MLRSYGRAEEFLGEWLRSRRPGDVVVSSKWGYVYTAGWRVDADPPEVKRHDADTLRRQLAETRERLGQWLALYQIHSATPDSGVLEDEVVLRELAALRDGGLAVGVTVSGTSQPEMLDRVVELGVFDSAQATWNLHERAAEDALARAHRADTLRSNLRATRVEWSDELERRLAPLQEDTRAYWARRAELSWN